MSQMDECCPAPVFQGGVRLPDPEGVLYPKIKIFRPTPLVILPAQNDDCRTFIEPCHSTDSRVLNREA
jgi:hypothetical protein